MRPIEALLSAANLIAFLSLILPLPTSMNGLRYAAPLTCLITLMQIAVEGYRWQMIPAYILALIFLLIWLYSTLIPNLHVYQIVVIISGLLGVVGMLVAVLLPIALPIFHFPRPTGTYAIGTLTYHWIDASRLELFTSNPDDPRELMAQVWYPAIDQPSAPRAPYINDADSATPVMARLTDLPTFLLSHFRYVTNNAVEAARIAVDQPAYPVLIFLSGLDGYRQVNTFQVEELVSQGYIVVALDQPGAVALTHFPDGREVSGMPRDDIQPLIEQSVEPQPTAPALLGRPLPEGIIPYFARDVSFALDQLAVLNQSDPNGILTGRFDLEHIGIFGVSLGGINAAHACLNDVRLKACLIMDVFMSSDVVNAGLEQPAMWITRDADTMRLERARAGGWTERDIEQHQTTMRAVYENLRADGYYLQIPGMFHLNLTDFPYWSPFMSQLGMTGAVNNQRIFDIVNVYTVAFFNKHLKGQPSSLLENPSPQYPEVIFETRHG